MKETRTTKDRWIGLLVSFHNDLLYSGEETCEDMKTLLLGQAEWREKTLAELKTSDSEEHLRLEPWPFKIDLVAVCWEERVWRQLSFSDEKALQTALDAPNISIRTMTFKE